MTERRNFRCKFNQYVIPENRDAVVRSVISQLDGYFGEPEVTLVDDNEFIISVSLGDNLTASMVRDKLLWNYFIHSVSAQESIRRVQILRLPKSSSREEVSQDLGDSGVDPFLNVELPDVSSIIGDEGKRPKSSHKVFNSVLHYADPTGQIIPKIFNGTNEDLDVDQLSSIHDMNTPSVLTSSRHYAFGEGDSGGYFGDSPSQATQHGVNVTKAPQETRGRTEQNEGITDPGTAPPISFQGFFGNDPLVDDSFKSKSEHSKGPLDFTASKHDDAENDGYEAGPVPQLGVGEVVDGEPINHGWFSASTVFGLNDHYTYESDVNDDFDF